MQPFLVGSLTPTFRCRLLIYLKHDGHKRSQYESVYYRTAQKALVWLSLFHLLVITSSNYLVQLPISIFGFHTTWGAFSFPFIFLATDLTVRILAHCWRDALFLR